MNTVESRTSKGEGGSVKGQSKGKDTLNKVQSEPSKGKGGSSAKGQIKGKHIQAQAESTPSKGKSSSFKGKGKDHIAGAEDLSSSSKGNNNLGGENEAKENVSEEVDPSSSSKGNRDLKGKNKAKENVTEEEDTHSSSKGSKDLNDAEESKVDKEKGKDTAVEGAGTLAGGVVATSSELENTDGNITSKKKKKRHKAVEEETEFPETKQEADKTAQSENKGNDNYADEPHHSGHTDFAPDFGDDFADLFGDVDPAESETNKSEMVTPTRKGKKKKRKVNAPDIAVHEEHHDEVQTGEKKSKAGQVDEHAGAANKGVHESKEAANGDNHKAKPQSGKAASKGKVQEPEHPKRSEVASSIGKGNTNLFKGPAKGLPKGSKGPHSLGKGQDPSDWQRTDNIQDDFEMAKGLQLAEERYLLKTQPLLRTEYHDILDKAKNTNNDGKDTPLSSQSSTPPASTVNESNLTTPATSPASSSDQSTSLAKKLFSDSESKEQRIVEVRVGSQHLFFVTRKQ